MKCNSVFLQSKLSWKGCQILGNSLEKLKIIDFEAFRPQLENAFCKERKSNAGRPPHDVVMMFKILVFQRLFNLSDDPTKYQITDRMNFQRFIGLSLGERVPDSKTIWLFRDTLTQSGVIRDLFVQFNGMLAAKGIKFTDFLTEEDKVVYADSAYVGKEIPDHVENRVCEKGYRNNPLTVEQRHPT